MPVLRGITRQSHVVVVWQVVVRTTSNVNMRIVQPDRLLHVPDEVPDAISAVATRMSAPLDWNVRPHSRPALVDPAEFHARVAGIELRGRNEQRMCLVDSVRA